jgi:hypothetical protein
MREGSEEWDKPLKRRQLRRRRNYKKIAIIVAIAICFTGGGFVAYRELKKPTAHTPKQPSSVSQAKPVVDKHADRIRILSPTTPLIRRQNSLTGPITTSR